MKVAHAVISRWNVKGMLDEEWLRHRMKLFRKYTAPSLASQTIKDFIWLLLCDPASPQWLYDEIEQTMGRQGLDFAIVDWYAKRGWFPAAREEMPEDASVYITTRIDNDDAIHKRHLELVRKEVRERASLTDFIISFPYGQHFHVESGQAKDRSKLLNPFLTRVERKPRDEIMMVMGKGHGRWPRESVVPVTWNEPMWLCVVHDRNALNRIRAGGPGWQPANLSQFGCG